MRFWKFGLVACLLVLAGCDPFPQTWEWNQKLTVEVATPKRLRSGSATTEVRWQEENSSGNYPGSYRGEATAVDLGDGKYLFALLSEETRYLALRTFANDLGENALINEMGFAAMAALGGTREVPRERYPLLVTFGDINDPTTVKRVDPDDLAASFGPGVSLKRITLTITDERVTAGEVEKRLGWLGEYYGKQLDGQRYETIKSSNRFANSLGAGNFDTER